MGRQKYSKLTPGNIAWPSEPIKILGIFVGHDKEFCYQKNWKNKLASLEHMLSAWTKRNLTVVGRINIIKTLGISKLLYNASILDVPENIIKEVDKIIFKFIWKNKSEKVKRKVMYGGYDQGGLRVSDFRSQVAAYKLKWFRRLYEKNDGDVEKWKILPLLYFENIGPLIVTANLSKVPLCLNIPPFYNSVAYAIQRFNESQLAIPVNYNSIMEQIIWGNKFICVKDKALYNRKWIDSGIIKIKDIVEKNNFITSEQLIDKLKFKHNWISEYTRIINAIPKEWKNTIYNHNICKNENNLNKNPLLSMTIRQLYNLLQKDRIQIPLKIQGKWEALLDQRQIDWKKVWYRKISMVKENRFKQLNFKLLHMIIPTKMQLYKWKIIDNYFCTRCKVADDELHYFYYCNNAKTLWCFIKKKFNLDRVPTLPNIILGTDSKFINDILNLGTFCIAKARTLKFYDKWKLASITSLFEIEYNKRHL